MRHSKSVRFAIAFTRFCMEEHIAPKDAAELVTLAKAAFHAGERECNTGIKDDRAANELEKLAEVIGYTVAWPGLWPQLKRGDFYVSIPCED